MSFGTAEARLRALEARIRGAEIDVSGLRLRLGKNDQDLVIIRPGNGICYSRIFGLVACDQTVATPLSTIQIVGHTTGINYGTYSCPLGTFDISIQIDPSDSQLDVAASKVGARFRAALAVATGFSRCGSSAQNAFLFPAENATPGVGYRNAGGCCNYPVAATLKLDDARMGVTALPILANGGTSTWAGNVTGPPALQYQFIGRTGTTPANVAGVTITPPGSTYSFGAATSVTPPDDAGTLFSATYTAPTTALGYTAGDTLTVYE